MKLPGGYGGIIKLSGKRRRPYAVRKIKGYKKNGTPLYDYLGYFEDKKSANIFLAQYNEGKLTHDNRTSSSALFLMNGSPNMKDIKASARKHMNRTSALLTSFQLCMIKSLRTSK